jgi:hypothetical protein
MARIPDVSTLGDRPAPQTSAPLTQDRSGLIMAQANIEAADQIGRAVERYADNRDQFKVAKAGAEFSKLDSTARKFDDNDWESYESRYRKTLSDAKDKILQDVRIPRNRALLSQQLDSATERGALEVRGLARTKEIEFGKADLSSTLDTYRDAALSVNDEPTKAQNIQGAQLAIKSALDAGYIDPTDAERLNKQWTQSYAEGSLSMQPAEQRIETLSKPKGTVADFLAPDRKAALLKQAQNESRELRVRRDSQQQEDALVAKHGDNWTSALKAAREITDPEVRDATVSRIKVREAEAKQSEIETRESLQEDAMAFLNGGGKFADLPLKIKNGLPPSSLNALRSYSEQVAGGGVKHTDPETLIELSKLSSDDPQKFGELDMMQYRPKLTDQDFEQYVDLQRKIRSGSLDGKATGFMTLNQVRDDRVKQLFGSTQPAKKESAHVADARRKFVTQYETQLRAFKQQNGKQPTSDDARKILDDMTREVITDNGMLFDTKKKAYEVSLEDVPDADRAEITAELTKRKKPVTDQAILDLFIRANIK